MAVINSGYISVISCGVSLVSLPLLDLLIFLWIHCHLGKTPLSQNRSITYFIHFCFPFQCCSLSPFFIRDQQSVTIPCRRLLAFTIYCYARNYITTGPIWPSRASENISPQTSNRKSNKGDKRYWTKWLWPQPQKASIFHHHFIRAWQSPFQGEYYKVSSIPMVIRLVFVERRRVYFWNDAAFSVCQQWTLIRRSIRLKVGGWRWNLSEMSAWQKTNFHMCHFSHTRLSVQSRNFAWILKTQQNHVKILAKKWIPSQKIFDGMFPTHSLHCVPPASPRMSCDGPAFKFCQRLYS